MTSAPRLPIEQFHPQEVYVVQKYGSSTNGRGSNTGGPSRTEQRSGTKSGNNGNGNSSNSGRSSR